MSGVIEHTCPCGATFRATYTTHHYWVYANDASQRWQLKHLGCHQPKPTTTRITSSTTSSLKREVNGL